MTTIGRVIDRILRTYLEPPDAQPVTAYASGTMTANATDDTLTVAQYHVPEDEQLVRLGTVLQMKRELMLVTNYNDTSKTAIVKRAQLGTDLEAHANQDTITIAPAFPRQSIFESVADNCTALSPHLYTVRTVNLHAIDGFIYPIADPLALNVLEITDGYGSDIRAQGRIVDYHPRAGGRAMICSAPLGEVWLKYTRRIGEVTAETDTLDDLGIEDRWVGLLMAGVAADLLVGRDVPETHVQWVSQILKAENIRVGQRQQVGIVLAQYRDLLLRRFAQEMNSEYKINVHMRDPFSVVSERPFG